MDTVVLGGLGGGGDIGLALILSKLIPGARIVYASFADCKPVSYKGKRVAGSLYIPTSYHHRDFEWALKTLNPSLHVYRICVKTGKEEVLQALDWLAHRYKPKCTLHVDIGGDGILTGYETSLGSYIVDSMARAVIAEASEKHGWKSLLAIGGLHLEGGRRRVLDLAEQVAALLYHRAHNALLGVIDPPREAAEVARILLNPGREMVSVMLPLYIAALEGRTAITITKGYSIGRHTLDWWTRYVFIVDGKTSCNISPLCMTARRKWLAGLRGWQTPSPPRDYLKALKQAKQDPERILRKLIREHTNNNVLREICLEK